MQETAKIPPSSTRSFAYDEAVGSEQFREIADRAMGEIETIRKFIDLKKRRERVFNLTQLAQWTGFNKMTLSRRLRENGYPKGVMNEKKTARVWSVADLRKILELEGKAFHRNPETDPPVVIAVQNNKGGSAKTTVAMHLAVYLTLRGMNVGVCDMDPQGSATAIANYQPDYEVDENATVLPFIRGIEDTLDYAVRPVRHWPGLDIIPAASGLSEIDFDLPVKAQNDKTGKYEFYMELYNGLATVVDRWDVLIIDSPPSMTFTALNCVFGATALIVPVPAQALVYDSFRKFNDMLANFLPLAKQRRGTAKRFNWVRTCITQYMDNKDQQNLAKKIRLASGPYSMEPNWVHTQALMGKEVRTLYDITEYAGSRDTYQRAVESVNSVNKVFLQLLLDMWPSTNGKQA